MHDEKHLKNRDFLTDIVIGMSDGLTVPFVLAAGLSGALVSTSIILVAGVAGIAAGSVAMGFGGYFAGKAEHRDLKKEYDAVKTIPQKERDEVREFFSNIGLSKEMQEKATAEITKDKQQWVEFMMKYELGINKPDPRRATRSALNIGVSYVIGGMVSLSPYLFTDAPLQALKISAILTLASLFIFGFFKSRITGVQPLLGGLRLTITGAVAAAAAFGIASLLK